MHLIPETLPEYEATLFYQNYFLLANQVKKCEREFKPDFFISMLWAGPEIFRKIKTRKILYVHFPTDVFLSSRKSLRLFHAPVLKAQYHGLKDVNIIVYSSNYVKDIAHNSSNYYLPQQKSDVIYPCINWNSFQKSTSNNRKRRVCFVGRIIEDKGIDIVVDAFLKANVKESELVVAGNFPSYKRLDVLLREKLLSLQNRGLSLIENPSDEEVAGIYGSSMAFADFCPNETFGMCVVEAMAAGTPPIVADGGGQKETVLNGVTGFRVSPKANSVSDEMANYMRLLLTNEKVFAAMSKQARLRAREFDESVFVRKWIQMLR